jgi:putative phosphoesterase
MRIAILSDIHGNIFALRNVLHFLRKEKIEDVFFLGDALGYLPWGVEVLQTLKEERIHCIQGNHEAMLLGELAIKENAEEVYKLNLVKEKLTDELKEFIQTWDESCSIHYENEHFFLTHGSPANFLEGYVYPDSTLPNEEVPEGINHVIIGHTHHPFIREHQGVRWINVGSVGLPRDQGNLSSFSILDLARKQSIIYRIPFNVEEVIESCKKTEIHEATVDCLRREAKKEVVGTIIIA